MDAGKVKREWEGTMQPSQVRESGYPPHGQSLSVGTPAWGTQILLWGHAPPAFLTLTLYLRIGKNHRQSGSSK